MRGRRPNFVLNVSDEDRRFLEQLVRRTTAPAGEVKRARVVLLVMSGSSVTAAAAQVGLTFRNARKWLDRFIEKGTAGLKDLPRPGRKPVFSP